MKFTDFLRLYQVPIKESGEHHHVTQGWVGMDCPQCSKDSYRYKLGYNLHTNHLYCWSCGSLPLISTLHEITGASYSKIRELLGSLEVSHLPAPKVFGKIKLPKGVGELQAAHRNYLTTRGLDSNEIVALWGVQGIGIAPKLGWRLFIPVLNQGKIVTWTTRSISPKSHTRYVSAKVSESSQGLKDLLYGEDHVRNAICVCEGPIDVWSIGYGAVATLGVGYSQKQLIKISKYPKRIVCFDSDPDAQKRARRLCRDLSPFPGETLNLVLESGKDPNEANKEELSQIRRMLD